MRLAIMQPYFFPYIGYFQLMDYVDRWVVFDDVQFIDKGWVNRNRILHPDPKKEWQYISIPLSKKGRFDRIIDVCINKTKNWRAEITGKLTAYKRKAPYYDRTMGMVNDVLDFGAESLSEFVVHSLNVTSKHLGLNTPIDVYSEMRLGIDEVEHPGQWALKISDRLDATEYVNPPGGYEIFRAAEFSEKNIALTFLKPNLSAYKQRREGFVPGLSIIDVLMWNDLDAIQNMLKRDFQCLTQNEISHGKG